MTVQRLSILGLTLLASGCATVTTGTSQSVTLDTPMVEGAKCELTDKKGGKWYVMETPGTVQVRKGDGPMTVICRKDGYHTTTRVVAEDLHGATLGNIILGGGIGIFVDAMSGAAQQYPDQIVVWMEPISWESEAQRTEWESKKAAWEKEEAEKEEARKKAAQPKDEQ